MAEYLPKTIERYFDRLWPIARSITGPGFRQSLDILNEIMPTDRLIFQSGEKVLDWTVPEEWLVRQAYLIGPDKIKRADFKDHNLHLVSYSVPFRGVLPLEKLADHLYSLPDQPAAIPYLTSYYQKRWGFCLAHDELRSLPRGDYQVVVDTELVKGQLIVAEAVLPGSSKKEILFSSCLCHPSLANNELSGPLLLSFLYRELAQIKNRYYSYRFVLAPETIGAVAYLSKRGQRLKNNLLAGYQLSCLGDSARLTYKQSRRGNTLADRAARQIMREQNNNRIINFDPAIGSDERQYCSPGFNLPVGTIMRTVYTTYPEYHTSLDNKELMDFEKMAETIRVILQILNIIEKNKVWLSQFQQGEPQLGPRGLYRSLSGINRQEEELAMWWLLNYADGERDLLDIAERSGQKISALIKAAERLEQAGLIKKLTDD